MPELPEVETIKRGLKAKIINKKISKVQVKTPTLIKIPQPDEFINQLKGALVINVESRGKYIIICLNTMYRLVIHLGMSGRLIYQSDTLSFFKKLRINEKHNHIFFFFRDGSKIVYNDVRKFGKMWLLKKNEKLPRIESLGFEPLDPSFTFNKLFQLFNEKGKVNIKSFLINQKNIAGIGNIYANEILFQAGIHPLRKANSLTKKETKRLYLNIKNILSKAIAYGGTTMIDESYLDLNGKKGEYGKEIMVYGKKAGKCPVCGKPLEVIRIENRSTFICSNCQN